MKHALIDSEPENTESGRRVAAPTRKSKAKPLPDFGPGSYVGDAPAAQFVIKGNSRSMKFHGPWSPWFASTVPEVWFDSPESALAAGFSDAAPSRRATYEARMSQPTKGQIQQAEPEAEQVLAPARPVQDDRFDEPDRFEEPEDVRPVEDDRFDDDEPGPLFAHARPVEGDRFDENEDARPFEDASDDEDDPFGLDDGDNFDDEPESAPRFARAYPDYEGEDEDEPQHAGARRYVGDEFEPVTVTPIPAPASAHRVVADEVPAPVSAKKVRPQVLGWWIAGGVAMVVLWAAQFLYPARTLPWLWLEALALGVVSASLWSNRSVLLPRWAKGFEPGLYATVTYLLGGLSGVWALVCVVVGFVNGSVQTSGFGWLALVAGNMILAASVCQFLVPGLGETFAFLDRDGDAHDAR